MQKSVLIQQRQDAGKPKIFAVSDRIQQAAAEPRRTLIDSPDGTRWHGWNILATYAPPSPDAGSNALFSEF